MALLKKHEPPLLLVLKPSEQLKQLLIILYLLALVSCFANALPVSIKLSLSTLISLYCYDQTTSLLKTHYTIKHSDALGWEISTNNRDFQSIQILNSTVITQWAIFLHFNNNAKKQSVLIPSDALSTQDYRLLIVRLKTTVLN